MHSHKSIINQLIKNCNLSGPLEINELVHRLIIEFSISLSFVYAPLLPCIQSALDISADVPELGRTPMAVVCAGVKSILDIGRTLEALVCQDERG